MTFDIELEEGVSLPIEVEEIAKKVMDESLNYVDCPYETEIHLILTDDEEIRIINIEQRNIDSATDVLSFPMIDYRKPGDFSVVEENIGEYFNPETGELLLGDIAISADKVLEQSEKYGHSVEREFAFLVAHSMLHLFGYDHMEPEEAKVMEKKQSEILENLGILR